MNHEDIKNFLKEVGLTQKQFCTILNISRQTMHNLKCSKGKYHRYLRELIFIVINSPQSLGLLLIYYPERFDEAAKKLTMLYVKDKKCSLFLKMLTN